MSKRMTFVIILLVVIFGGTFGFFALKQHLIKKAFQNYRPPPVTVAAIKARTSNWQPSLQAVGTLKAINGVDINSRVNGQIIAIYFKSGEIVKKGQSLIQLDDSIYQQTLKDNLAEMRLNKLNYDRQLKLYQRRATSKSELDAARAKMLQSQAKVQSARLNIQYKNIKAPFTGKIGIRNVDLGEYVTPGKALASLQSMDPLYVDFELPEQYLRDVYMNQPILLSVEAYPNKKFKGQVNAINSEVDVNTRTILVRGEVPNDKNELYPGIFANVQVILPQRKNAIVIPQTAVTYNLYGDLVYVVEQKGKDKDGKPILIVKQRFVTVGDRQNNSVVIKKGLKAGETVVISGQIKLQNNSRVIINNKIWQGKKA